MVNIYDNVAGADSDYYTWELTATKRMSTRLVVLMSFSKTWSAAQARPRSSAPSFRQNALPVTPNDLINTEPDGKINYTDWYVEVARHLEAPLGLKISPMLRLQAGQNWGRTFLTTLELRHRPHRGRTAQHQPSGQRHRVRLPHREGRSRCPEV